MLIIARIISQVGVPVFGTVRCFIVFKCFGFSMGETSSSECACVSRYELVALVCFLFGVLDTVAFMIVTETCV